MGKIEIESLDEGRDGAIMEHLIKGAVLTVFKEVVPPEHTRAVVDAFEEGAVAHTGEGVTSEELARLVEEVDALRAPVAALTGGDESPGSRRCRGRVRPRGPPPEQATEQGFERRQRHLPRPHLSETRGV